MPRLTSNFFVCLLLVAALFPDEQVSAVEAISFNRQIRPILSENCFSCHGFDPKHREADLRLDVFEDAARDRDGSRAIAPGDISKSELWKRILSSDPDEMMPPPTSNKPALSSAQKELIKQWIEQGAKYETHWAFISPVRSELNVTGGAAIDHFINKELAKVGLKMSKDAPAEKLIRRVSLDLIGLPPTIEEVDDFLSASAKDADAAYNALVERLLKSPHYGERWGRWWLDQARYADSNGYSIDAPRSIWKYRDWVVKALNADMPFDQFTVEQLAGDLLPSANEGQKIASGFHRNTTINQEGGIDPEQFRIDSVFDRVATTGTVWLGLSVGCAQCHDHKFDPIEQKEYYQFFAFLNNQEEPTLKVSDASYESGKSEAEFKAAEKALVAYLEEHKQQQLDWEAELTDAGKNNEYKKIKPILAKPYAKRTVAENASIVAVGVGAADMDYRALNEKYKAAQNAMNNGITTMVMKERDQPRKTTVFIKGDFTRPADEVQPGTPKVLHPYANTSGKNNRLDLARWIVDPKNPLTARVIMNRIWQQHFGRGLVETENDFGSQGSVPSHPELLDWLAGELLERHWSLREMQRVIVTSRTYRQSSAERPDTKKKDPNNYLLGRQQRLRLDAELVRDTALTASGLLSPKMGGAPVYPPIPEGVMGLGQVKRVWTVSKGEDRYRRGIYTFVYRATPPPSLVVFDSPDGQSSCTRRIRSNTPLQALTLLNDTSFFEFANALKSIIEKDGLEKAFRRCTSRQPAADEIKLLSQLDSLSSARVLLNLDETITRD